MWKLREEGVSPVNSENKTQGWKSTISNIDLAIQWGHIIMENQKWSFFDLFKEKSNTHDQILNFILFLDAGFPQIALLIN